MVLLHIVEAVRVLTSASGIGNYLSGVEVMVISYFYAKRVYGGALNENNQRKCFGCTMWALLW
ncbi:MAG: hypothetical protein H6Q67_1687 [Firmicutes bacterium]|nr:hypothetical protein [Bacillota bacterium]